MILFDRRVCNENIGPWEGTGRAIATASHPSFTLGQYCSSSTLWQNSLYHP